MKKHDLILKEITDEFELSLISGGQGGSGDWGTGAHTVWGAAVGGVAGSLGYNCAYPGPVYGTNNPVPTGMGTCVGGMTFNPHDPDTVTNAAGASDFAKCFLSGGKDCS